MRCDVDVVVLAEHAMETHSLLPVVIFFVRCHLQLTETSLLRSETCTDLP